MKMDKTQKYKSTCGVLTYSWDDSKNMWFADGNNGRYVAFWVPNELAESRLNSGVIVPMDRALFYGWDRYGAYGDYERESSNGVMFRVSGGHVLTIGEPQAHIVTVLHFDSHACCVRVANAIAEGWGGWA